ncbi:MAG TPA: hypothetical protein VGL29_17840, partial [Blastocatellia bacterium]
GTILQSGLVPIEPVIVSWEMSIRLCYQVLEPYIREMQKPENAGPQYWGGFEWLYSQIDPMTASRRLPKSSVRNHVRAAHR